VLTERRPTQRYRHTERDNKRERERERERGVLNELDKELGCFWVLQVWRKAEAF
jgi:hypothetical protein